MSGILAIITAGATAALFKPFLYVNLALIISLKEMAAIGLWKYEHIEIALIAALFSTVYLLIVYPSFPLVILASLFGLLYLAYLGVRWWPFLTKWPNENE